MYPDNMPPEFGFPIAIFLILVLIAMKVWDYYVEAKRAKKEAEEAYELEQQMLQVERERKAEEDAKNRRRRASASPVYDQTVDENRFSPLEEFGISSSRFVGVV